MAKKPQKSAKTKELTLRQQRFVDFLLEDPLLRQGLAAQRAGYADYDSEASKLTKKSQVKAAIDAGMKDLAKRNGMRAEAYRREIDKVALTDTTEAFDDSGMVKPFKEIPDHVRRCIKSIKVNELFAGQGEEKTVFGLCKEISFHDKNRAMELGGKSVGLFVEKIEHSGEVGFAERVKRARERVTKS